MYILDRFIPHMPFTEYSKHFEIILVHQRKSFLWLNCSMRRILWDLQILGFGKNFFVVLSESISRHTLITISTKNSKNFGPNERLWKLFLSYKVTFRFSYCKKNVVCEFPCLISICPAVFFNNGLCTHS